MVAALSLHRQRVHALRPAYCTNSGERSAATAVDVRDGATRCPRAVIATRLEAAASTPGLRCSAVGAHRELARWRTCRLARGRVGVGLSKPIACRIGHRCAATGADGDRLARRLWSCIVGSLLRGSVVTPAYSRTGAGLAVACRDLRLPARRDDATPWWLRTCLGVRMQVAGRLRLRKAALLYRPDAI